MLAAFVNVLAVLAGGALGLLLRRGMPARFGDTLTKGLGLCVIAIGVSGALETQNMIVVIICVALGGLLGAWIDIERRLDTLGKRIETRLTHGKGDGGMAKGFVSASLLFCVGAMAVVGSLSAGLRHDYQTIFAKSALDFISAIFLASAYGAGVLLGAASVLIYQGAITLLSGALAPVLSDAVVAEMSAAGGVLIIGIGLNMIRKEHIPVGNLLPAILLPPVVLLFFR